jgi:hypothetical protein
LNTLTAKRETNDRHLQNYGSPQRIYARATRLIRALAIMYLLSLFLRRESALEMRYPEFHDSKSPPCCHSKFGVFYFRSRAFKSYPTSRRYVYPVGTVDRLFHSAVDRLDWTNANGQISGSGCPAPSVNSLVDVFSCLIFHWAVIFAHVRKLRRFKGLHLMTQVWQSVSDTLGLNVSCTVKMFKSVQLSTQLLDCYFWTVQMLKTWFLKRYYLQKIILTHFEFSGSPTNRKCNRDRSSWTGTSFSKDNAKMSQDMLPVCGTASGRPDPGPSVGNVSDFTIPTVANC